MAIGENYKRLEEFKLVDKLCFKCIQPEEALNVRLGRMAVK